MHIFHDPACADYAAPGHPEAPFRVLRTAEHLHARHPDWTWSDAAEHQRAWDLADDAALLRAHTPAYLARLRGLTTGMFDPDTAALPGMADHARRAAGAAIGVVGRALQNERAFALMRPPGHHATREAIMGFCYVNQVAVAALHARAALGAARVAVWDFDAHHGNGTEDISRGQEGLLYVSVHQYPGYPGTGTASFDNVRNHPVAPGTAAERHLDALARSWADVRAFAPDLVLVSAGFDAYAGDPLTDLRLRPREFAELGRWLHDAPFAVGTVLEGGYSPDLPVLAEAFLAAWEEGK